MAPGCAESEEPHHFKQHALSGPIACFRIRRQRHERLAGFQGRRKHLVPNQGAVHIVLQWLNTDGCGRESSPTGQYIRCTLACAYSPVYALAMHPSRRGGACDMFGAKIRQIPSRDLHFHFTDPSTIPRTTFNIFHEQKSRPQLRNEVLDRPVSVGSVASRSLLVETGHGKRWSFLRWFH